jgi:hypothetical protein
MFHILALRTDFYLHDKQINVHLFVYHISIEILLCLSAQYLEVLLDKLKKIMGHLAIRPCLKPSALFQTKPHLLRPEQTKLTIP